ncbi:MAG: acetolactate synthase small subunit, partial [Bacteroidota bacterium]
MEKLYTISIFTENEPGLLHRITTVFTRRHVNLESFTASQTKVESIYRFTIVVKMSSERVIKIVKQLDKIIGVFNAFLHQEEDVVHQEVALYKLPTHTLVNG